MALGSNTFTRTKADGTQLSNKLLSLVNYGEEVKEPYTYRDLGSMSSMNTVKSSYAFDKYENNPLIPENNPHKVVDHHKTSLTAGGFDVPERKSPSLMNGLMTVLDVIQRPQYMVTNTLEDLTDDKKDSFGDVLKGMGQGLTGARKSYTTDVLDNLGWENNDAYTWYGKAKNGDGSLNFSNTLRGLLGFVGDVALDPTTYLTAGTLAAGKAMAKKGLAKTAGKELGEKAIKAGITEGADDLVTSLAQAFGRSEDAITKMASKHGNSSELVMKIAKQLGNIDGVGKVDLGTARYILDNGLDVVNKDMIGDTIQQLGHTKSNFTDALNKTLSTRYGASGNLFGKNVTSGAFDIRKLDPMKQNDVLDEMINIFSPENAIRYTLEDKKKVMANLFDVTDPRASLYLKTMPDEEVAMIQTLFNAFGDKASGGEIIERANKLLGTMTDDLGKLRENPARTLRDALHNERSIRSKIKKIDKGVEFSNGIQQVLDDASGRFMLKYHNPFTGTVKPLVDLSDTVVSEGMRKATQAVVELNPIKPLVDIAGWVFKPDYISSGLKKVPHLYKLGKDVADDVTTFLHKETGLAKQALRGATGLFKNNPEFLGNQKLRRALTTYIQRENDRYARATWKYIAGEAIDSADTDAIEALQKLEAVGALSKKYNALKLTPDEKSIVESMAAKVKVFNESMLQFDANRGLVFHGVEGVDPVELLEENTGKYVRHYPKKSKDALGAISVTQTQKDAMKGATSTVHSPGFKKRFQSIAMQEAEAPDMEYVDDIITSMALRNHESLRVALNRRFTDSLKTSMKEIEGFEDIISTQHKHGLVKTELGDDVFFVHPDMANQFTRVTQAFTTNQGEQKLLEYYDKLTNMIKQTQTSLNPAFLLKNWIGEPMMNWFAGVDLKSHKEAMDILKQIKTDDITKIGDDMYHKGKPMYRRVVKDVDGVKKEFLLDASETGQFKGSPKIPASAMPLEGMEKAIARGENVKLFKFGNKEFTATEIMEKFEEMGLGWSGISKGNLIENMEKVIKREVLKSSDDALGKIKNIGMEAGDFVETWTRLSHFIDRLKKGMSFEDAAADVRRFHVDYRDLTSIERNKFRRIAPYYTYMRKNLPIQMRMLLTEHNKVGMVAHLVDSSHRAVSNDNFLGQDIDTQDYLKEGLAIPISVDDKGNVRYLNWNLPLADLSRLKYNAGDLFQTNVLDMLHPLVKTPMEITANTNLRFQSPIEKYEGEKAPILPNWEGAPEVVPKQLDYATQQFGVVQSLRKALGQGISQATGEREDPLKPRNPLTYALLDSVLPLKNQQNVRNNQAYDYRDQLQQYITRLRREGKDVPKWTPELENIPRVYYTP
jgi:hypothetical protein